MARHCTKHSERWYLLAVILERYITHSMATGRSTCFFSGNVQGVGFRYTAMNIAQRYDVVGYVRNLSDGRVELVIEGSEADRKSLIGEIRQHMDEFISEVQTAESSATGEFSRFSIRH